MAGQGIIKIKYKPQRIQYSREVELPDGLLSLDDIAKHLKKGELFCFFQKEEGGLGLPVDYLCIQGYRYETKEEFQSRVARQETYNKMINRKYK